MFCYKWRIKRVNDDVFRDKNFEIEGVAAEVGPPNSHIYAVDSFVLPFNWF